MSKKDKKKRDSDDEDEAFVAPGIDFDIDPENVKDAYIRIPSYIATLNAIYATSVGRSIRAKYQRDRAYAEINAEILESLPDNAKKPAEAQIKQQIMLHPEYEKAVMAYAAAEEEKAMAWGRCEAMIAKKDMVVSLGAHVRQELQPGGGLDDEDRSRSNYAPDDDDDED